MCDGSVVDRAALCSGAISLHKVCSGSVYPHKINHGSTNQFNHDTCIVKLWIYKWISIQQKTWFLPFYVPVHTGSDRVT